MIQRERLVLIGHPVARSLSPAMHNAALDAAGIAVRYEALDVEPGRLEPVLLPLADTRSAGNFTIPHKKSAVPFMHDCSDVARRAGAVNTFTCDGDGFLQGDNTDVAGFEAAITELIGRVPNGARFAVLGAGGAAAAVLTAIDGWEGASASLHTRDLARGMAVSMRHSAVVRVCSMRDPCLADADIVVNATPIGMHGDDQPTELERLAAGAVVHDLAYRAGETTWVREARSRGHLAADGLRMLLHQGVAAFRIWFEVEPDAGVMWRALQEATRTG